MREVEVVGCVREDEESGRERAVIDDEEEEEEEDKGKARWIEFSAGNDGGESFLILYTGFAIVVAEVFVVVGEGVGCGCRLVEAAVELMRDGGGIAIRSLSSRTCFGRLS
jgi:hypothetical protein